MTDPLVRKKQGLSNKQHQPKPGADARVVRQDKNPPRKTSNSNPERNPRDQKGRGGSK